ncbi:MAG: DUF349 domain-containing protein [Flavobacteriales bacterium]|nr:DUF349 domain-containing protein [Flavobacteriales bacterium]
MKSQLLEHFEQLQQTEDIMSIREAVRELQNEWKSESAKERQIQREVFDSLEHPEGTEFEFIPNELDEKLNEFMKAYRLRMDEHGKKLAAERLQNLELKTNLLGEFEKVIKEEQIVGKAFSSWNSLKEKWAAVGDVPGDKYHDLNDRYHKLAQEFFYNINIYRTLQEHDLKINQKKKEELIERAKEIAEIKSINEVELLMKTYQREWMEIGPSARDSYKELGDTFFGLMRVAYSRVNGHYEELRAHSEENLQRKKELVDKMKNVLSMEFTTISAWNKYTQDVLALQEDWRHSGFAPKKENEEIWSEFRGLCDLFFTKKKTWFESKKMGYKECRDKKEALIAMTKEYQESEDWKTATEAMKKLQEEWKTVGQADPRDEQKLWYRFRSACDVFFQKKKEHFAGMVGEQEQNLALKEAVIAELEQLEITGNKGTDLGRLKEVGIRWMNIGFIPREKMKEVNDRYNKIMDSKYQKLNVERTEKVMGEFRSRLEHIRGGTDGKYKMRNEKQNLSEKMDELIRERRQYENNMSIFKGAGAEALKKDIEKKIKATEREIEELKKKIQLIEV